MYAATGRPNVKWEGTDFKWVGRAPLALPLATALREVETHFSSDGYHRYVTSQTYEAVQVKPFAPHVIAWTVRKVLMSLLLSENPEWHVRSFPPWQQATMEIMRRNLSYYCLLATRIYIVVLRAYPVRIITQSTQRQRRGCNKSIRRTKEQQTRLQCLTWAMPKSAMPSRAIKSAKLLKKKAQGSGSVS